MDARRAALMSLTSWESGDRKIDIVLERELSNAGLDTRDTALAQNLTYGVLRWKGRIDWVLDQYVKGGLRPLPLPIRNALRLGLYQIDYLDRIPPRAAVSESVNLAKRYGHAGTAGLVNAVLRNILTSLRPDFPDIATDPVAHVSVVYSHPRVLVERWIARYGLDMTVVLCEYDNQVPRLVVRGNGITCTGPALGAALREEGRDTNPGQVLPRVPRDHGRRRRHPAQELRHRPPSGAGREHARRGAAARSQTGGGHHRHVRGARREDDVRGRAHGREGDASAPSRSRLRGPRC